jgi:hypothetical protein
VQARVFRKLAALLVHENHIDTIAEPRRMQARAPCACVQQDKFLKKSSVRRETQASMRVQELEVRHLVEQAHCDKQRACDDMRLALEASAAQTEEEISHRTQDLRAMVQRKEHELQEQAHAENVKMQSHRLASRSVLYWALHHWQRQADQQYQVWYALLAAFACATGRSPPADVARPVVKGTSCWHAGIATCE